MYFKLIILILLSNLYILFIKEKLQLKHSFRSYISSIKNLENVNNIESFEERKFVFDNISRKGINLLLRFGIFFAPYLIIFLFLRKNQIPILISLFFPLVGFLSLNKFKF